MWFLIVSTIIIGALLYKLFLLKPNPFWKNLGIREIDVSPAIGIWDILRGRKIITFGDLYAYDQMGSTDKYCGLIQMGKPTLLVKDVELIKKILIKDFDHFVNRVKMFHKEDGIIEKMLGNLEGDEWKSVRVSLSPTFTTGKIRRMMQIINQVGLDWVEEYTRKAKSNPGGSVVVNVETSTNQYTIEVISNTAFGFSAGVIKNPESPFLQHANKMADMKVKQIVSFAMKLMLPKLASLLGLTFFPLQTIAYFEGILERELKLRISGESGQRNDFLQLMAEAKKGELKAAGADELSNFEKDAQLSGNTESSQENKKQVLTEEIMKAQCINFFLAGYLPSSMTMSFLLYALAVHKDVQDRLREEVDKIFNDDGTLDYDDVGHLVYMDMVVCEVLRKAAAGRVERTCVKDYHDPDSGLKIPKGTAVAIPMYAIHNDKEYYENPDKFDPEHFSPEKKAQRTPYSYLAFGVGPRNCIGMRFALTEVKTAVAHMVHSFIIEPTEKTPVPFTMRPMGVQFALPKKLELRFIPRN